MPFLNQIKLLISLAQIDGKVAERERNYITGIGKTYDLNAEEIKPLFDQRHELIVPKDLTDDQKFEFLFSLVQLMKVDERMYKEEMMFCSKIAENLGYESDVMADFLLHVKAEAMEKDEVVNLNEITQRHLKK